MELESLLLKHYQVEKISGLMVALENPEGKYRAACAEDIEEALSTNTPLKNIVDVKIGNKWFPIRHPKIRKPKLRWRRQYY